MSFSTTRLVGSRVLVRGTDVLGNEGQTILDASQWDELKAHTAVDQATEAFDKAVEEFFAPLMAAADKLHQKINKPEDPIGFVVLREGSEGVEAQPAHVVELTHDSIVLRLLEQGDHARLVWVGDGLEVLEAQADTAASAPAEPSV